MIGFLLSLALAQAATPAVPWPMATPGRILATPDWSNYRTYPEAARLKEQEGRVRPDIRIDADGHPVECRILETSNFAELDAGTCERFMQMRFEPARDQSGRAIESHYSRRVTWRLTDEQPFASATLRARMRVDQGRVLGCRVERGDGPYVAYWSGLACSIFRDPKYYFGDRASGSIEAVIEVRLDAGDGAPSLAQPWSPGSLVSYEKIAFTVSPEGDAGECIPLERHGFGPRGLNNLSECGRLLSTLWFAQPEQPGPVRKGTYETRVIEITDR